MFLDARLNQPLTAPHVLYAVMNRAVGRHRHAKAAPAIGLDLELGLAQTFVDEAEGYNQSIVRVFDDRDLERLGTLFLGQPGPAPSLLLADRLLAMPSFHSPLAIHIGAVAG